jgi:hypothetical protein
MERYSRECVERLQVWAGSVVAQDHHVMLAINHDINYLPSKLLIRPNLVKRRSNGLKQYKYLLLSPQSVGGSTAKDLLSSDPSDFSRDATSTESHIDVSSRTIAIHHYAVYCCDVQTYKEKSSQDMCNTTSNSLEPYFSAHRFKLVPVLPLILVLHTHFSRNLQLHFYSILAQW